MFEEVIAQEGDTVDLIAFRRFGAHGSEGDILAANPGLAALGPIIPAGMKITIPVPGTPDRTEYQNVWGAK